LLQVQIGGLPEDTKRHRRGRPARVVEMVVVYEPDFFHKPEPVSNRATEWTTTAGPVETQMP
jgi:hypothetical protein